MYIHVYVCAVCIHVHVGTCMFNTSIRLVYTGSSCLHAFCALYICYEYSYYTAVHDVNSVVELLAALF